MILGYYLFAGYWGRCREICVLLDEGAPAGLRRPTPAGEAADDEDTNATEENCVDAEARDDDGQEEGADCGADAAAGGHQAQARGADIGGEELWGIDELEVCGRGEHQCEGREQRDRPDRTVRCHQHQRGQEDSADEEAVDEEYAARKAVDDHHADDGAGE